MRLVRIVALSVTFCLLAKFVFAGALDDKTPAYFVDRYGLAKSARTVSSATFIHEHNGNITVKGQVSVRIFRKGDLTVQAVFFLPSLQLASVQLSLPRQWTDEQFEAALAAYGGEWKSVKRGIVNTWVAPDGSRAISLLSSIEFQSRAVVDLVEKSRAEADAKRKAVPKL